MELEGSLGNGGDAELAASFATCPFVTSSFWPLVVSVDHSVVFLDLQPCSLEP